MLIPRSLEQKLSWQELLLQSITTAEQLADFIPVDVRKINQVIHMYPMRINLYYLSLIQRIGDPLWLQCVPDIRELDPHPGTEADPLREEAQSPVPHLIHRYPDRVVFLVSDQCAVYCRHCMRKRRVGRDARISPDTIDQGISYIQSNSSVREVILSGGDPFLLSDERLKEILHRIRMIPHVDILRIHTRVPCTLPQRVTGEMAAMLKRFHPLYVNIQFNHPDEITPEAVNACERLSNAGIPLGSQTVLLKGINDNPDIMMSLMRKLLQIRVKPYYLHHGDPVHGAGHFRTSIDKGLEIMGNLQGRISGIGIPQYMIDLPGGGGKVPLFPDNILKKE